MKDQKTYVSGRIIHVNTIKRYLHFESQKEISVHPVWWLSANVVVFFEIDWLIALANLYVVIQEIMKLMSHFLCLKWKNSAKYFDPKNLEQL